MKNIYRVNSYIHITSNEEVKDGEYGICLNLVREGFKSHQSVFKMDSEQRQAMEYLGGQKKAEVLKVILTTDQDLIKDGVQKIDDDFLEWFVQNPSCEWVEINYDSFEKTGAISVWEYEIIIPKESKQCEHDIIVKYGIVECQNCGMEHSEVLAVEHKQERMYSEEDLFKLTLDALNLGMTIRQEQLRGYCEKSGNELHIEWFKILKKK